MESLTAYTRATFNASCPSVYAASRAPMSSPASPAHSMMMGQQCHSTSAVNESLAPPMLCPEYSMNQRSLAWQRTLPARIYDNPIPESFRSKVPAGLQEEEISERLYFLTMHPGSISRKLLKTAESGQSYAQLETQYTLLKEAQPANTATTAERSYNALSDSHNNQAGPAPKSKASRKRKADSSTAAINSNGTATDASDDLTGPARKKSATKKSKNSPPTTPDEEEPARAPFYYSTYQILKACW